jgi:hypothetical protein
VEADLWAVAQMERNSNEEIRRSCLMIIDLHGLFYNDNEKQQIMFLVGTSGGFS